MKKTKELKIRKAIWREMKRFIKEGTEIEYLETRPEIFYNTDKMSEALERMMKVILS